MLIIDGHNLIGALPDEDLADPDDEVRLLARLRGYRSRSGQDMLVFFDSGDFPAQFPDLSTEGVRVRFAVPGQSADDAIIDFLLSRKEPGQYAVVTNDQGLRFRAASAGASLQSASDFAHRLARRPKPHAGQPADSGPDPRDPAFADLAAQFMHPGGEDARFGADLRAPAEIWIERLYGEDVEQARLAARWLGRFGGSAGAEPLRDALTHGDAGVRRAAVIALADLNEPAAVTDLAGRLAGDPSSMVREAAADSLGRIGGREAETALERAVEADGKGKVRKAARQALLEVRARRKSDRQAH
jgi:predicted RNA-binding protein with PIN domain